MILGKIKEALNALRGNKQSTISPTNGETASHDAVFNYRGFDIPRALMASTGGGPDTFDEISKMHIRNLERNIGIEPSAQVIEIGCGIGRDAIPLTERLTTEGSYIGIDIVKASISWCQSAITPRFPNFQFRHLDVKDDLYNPTGKLGMSDIRLPAADRSIDLIILQSVFTHMFAGDIEIYMREFARVLKDSGRVSATLFLYDDAVLESARRTNLTEFNLRFTHQHSPGCRINSLDCPTAAVAYTEAAFDALIEAAGLRLVKPYLRGGWSGHFSNTTDGQDVALLARR